MTRRCAGPLAAALFVLLSAAAARASVAMSVSPAGQVTLSLNGRAVATGDWHLHEFGYPWPVEPDGFDPGPVTAARGAQGGPTHAMVHAESGPVHVDYTFDLRGEDLTIAARVTNADPARRLRPVAFHGLTFHFNPQHVVGQIPVWHWTYLQAQGEALFHPSVRCPVGCWWAADDAFAFSIHSPSEFEQAKLVVATWSGHDNVVPPECEANLYTTRAVPPGGSVTVTVAFRITADRTLPHLLAPYKAEYDRHFPLPLYTPDDRLVGQFASVGQNQITPMNPLGYDGDGRRLDTPFGTAAYVQRYAAQVKRLGGVGMIFWSPGGYDPPMYPPDFDVLPPQVQRNIPALVSGFHARGLRVGLCARPGDGVLRPPHADPTIYRLSADDPQQMKADMARFRHAMDMGFDMFYLDSFGGYGINDVRILRQIRATVGPDVLLYPEYCTDLSLAYAGRYCELMREGTLRWTGWDMLDELRILQPRATWLCVSETDDPVPPAFVQHRLTPIMLDAALGRVRAWPPGSDR